MLEYYLQSFDTVELNNTFYRLPAEERARRLARGRAAAIPGRGAV